MQKVGFMTNRECTQLIEKEVTATLRFVPSEKIPEMN
jgi:hypothetical protein